MKKLALAGLVLVLGLAWFGAFPALTQKDKEEEAETAPPTEVKIDFPHPLTIVQSEPEKPPAEFQPPTLVPGPLTLAMSYIPCFTVCSPICMYVDVFSWTLVSNPDSLKYIAQILVGQEGQSWESGAAPGLIGLCSNMCARGSIGGGGGGGGGGTDIAHMCTTCCGCFDCVNCFDCINGCCTTPLGIINTIATTIMAITSMIPLV